MGLIKSLFSRDDIVTKGLDTVAKAGGSIVFTKQEQSEAQQKLADSYVQLMFAASPSRISRRLVAWLLVGVWTLIMVCLVVCAIAGLPEQAAALLPLLEKASPLTMLVAGFYFGGPIFQRKGK